jgi:hypothetical protein
MDDQGRVETLLEEIRDAQREHLAEYRRVTQLSLELQRRAVGRQEQFGLTYRRLLIAGAAIVLPLIVLLVYLLVRWGPYLLGR